MRVMECAASRPNYYCSTFLSGLQEVHNIGSKTGLLLTFFVCCKNFQAQELLQLKLKIFLADPDHKLLLLHSDESAPTMFKSSVKSLALVIYIARLFVLRGVRNSIKNKKLLQF